MKQCRLCKEDKKLIKASHIISDFLHEELYDEKHRIIKFHPNELKKANPKISTPPSATYEGGILCNTCDNGIIGKYETYVSKLIKNKLIGSEKVTCIETINSERETIIEVENLDYNKTKLFLLSILWRSSISSKPEFEQVNLGPYEEKIRTQLWNGIASDENDIQISILRFNKDGGFSTFISPPLKAKTGHTTYYSTIILGYLILFHLSESETSLFWKKNSIRQNGSLKMYELPKDKVSQFALGYTGVIKNVKL